MDRVRTATAAAAVLFVVLIVLIVMVLLPSRGPPPPGAPPPASPGAPPAAPHSGSPPSEPKDSPAYWESIEGCASVGADSGAPSITSACVNKGGNDMCNADDQCPPGQVCRYQKAAGRRVCTHPGTCGECKPYSSVESGDPDCLDYWEETDNSQRLLDTFKDRFDGASSYQCTNFHPTFDMTHVGAGQHTSTCKMSFTNVCAGA